MLCMYSEKKFQNLGLDIQLVKTAALKQSSKVNNWLILLGKKNEGKADRFYHDLNILKM